jgi:hypothetical protein
MENQPFYNLGYNEISKLSRVTLEALSAYSIAPKIEYLSFNQVNIFLKSVALRLPWLGSWNES